MLKSTDVRAWIASLGIAEDQHVYIGKLDNKQQKSIGVYGRSSSGPPNIALGGLECTTYDTKPVSLMVPEPQDVGTDDNGVYEYVIWLDLIYQRK